MGLYGKYKRLKTILMQMEQMPLLLEQQKKIEAMLTKQHLINHYEQQLISQNGEDGILAELFRRIGTTNRFFVEFGVEDGLQCNCGYLAAYQNWSGLMIEGDSERFQRLSRNYSLLPQIRTAQRFVTKDNIADIFREHGVPQELDLLSIDIDGNDYWVWKALHGYKARVVVIEYNAAFAPPVRWVMQYNETHVWDGTTYYGASLSSLTELGRQMGYVLLGTDKRGVNAFFLREDLLQLSGFPSQMPEEAYHPPRFGTFFGGHPWRDGSHVKI